MSSVRDQLAAALETVRYLGPLDRERVLDVLLPTMQRLIADALTAAADGGDPA